MLLAGVIAILDTLKWPILAFIAGFVMGRKF